MSSQMPNQPPIQPTYQPYYQPPTVPPTPPKKKWYQKWWVWVIIAILVLGAVVTQANKGNTDAQTDVFANTNNSTDKVTNQNESPTAKDDITESQEQNTNYAVGDSYESGGLVLTVDSCEEHISDNEFMLPEDGNMFIRVHITIKNVSGKDRSVGSTMFDCYADDVAIDENYFVGDDVLSLYDSISDGRSVTGYLYYEVPENSSVELEYCPDMYSKNNKVTYKLI